MDKLKYDYELLICKINKEIEQLEIKIDEIKNNISAINNKYEAISKIKPINDQIPNLNIQKDNSKNNKAPNLKKSKYSINEIEENNSNDDN